MTDEMNPWMRLVDQDHLRRILVDLSAFLVACSALTEYLVSSTHVYLGRDDGLLEGYNERDRRLAQCDPARPTEADIADAVEFFVDGGARTATDVERIARVGADRSGCREPICPLGHHGPH